MSYNTIDLFSGCGGMTLGFSWAGFKSILASDIDENCELTFKRNFPETPFICKSIIELTKKEIDNKERRNEVRQKKIELQERENKIKRG